MNEKIIIHYDKTKLILLLLGSLAFVALGVLFILKPEIFRRSQILIIGIGIASILFFGLCGIFIFTKLFSKKPALVIDENGIYDYSNAASAGEIL